MGASPSFTCAPYLLQGVPRHGEQVSWSESNAVVFANSVLGARTQKYADFLDLCIALTGRAPLAGCHMDKWRVPRLVLMLPHLPDIDDSFYPTAGYVCGLQAQTTIPLIKGLEQLAPTWDDLKAFGAAFATTSSAAMFHIAGVTPEASDHTETRGLQECTLTMQDFQAAWRELDSGGESAVQLVSLGNPHFSVDEFSKLAELVRGRDRHPEVSVVVTAGRDVVEAASAAGHMRELERFGVQLITDTCWCMLGEPVVDQQTRTLITNSGKYAHYAPGLVQKQVRFSSLRGCVSTACTGKAPPLPRWLRGTRAFSVASASSSRFVPRCANVRHHHSMSPHLVATKVLKLALACRRR